MNGITSKKLTDYWDYRNNLIIVYDFLPILKREIILILQIFRKDLASCVHLPVLLPE